MAEAVEQVERIRGWLRDHEASVEDQDIADNVIDLLNVFVQYMMGDRPEQKAERAVADQMYDALRKSASHCESSDAAIIAYAELRRLDPDMWWRSKDGTYG